MGTIKFVISDDWLISDKATPNKHLVRQRRLTFMKLWDECATSEKHSLHELHLIIK